MSKFTSIKKNILSEVAASTTKLVARGVQKTEKPKKLAETSPTVSKISVSFWCGLVSVLGSKNKSLNQTKTDWYVLNIIMYKYFKMSTTSLVVRHACNYSWPSLNPTKNILILTIVGPHPHSFLFFSLSSMPFSSLFIASIVPSFVSSNSDALSLSLIQVLPAIMVCLLASLSSIFILDFVSLIPNHPSSSFLLLFLTSQTPKPDWTKSKPNAIGRSSVLPLQISFGVEYVKTEILGSVQKLPPTPTDLNRLHPYLLPNCPKFNYIGPKKNLGGYKIFLKVKKS